MRRASPLHLGCLHSCSTLLGPELFLLFLRNQSVRSILASAKDWEKKSG